MGEGYVVEHLHLPLSPLFPQLTSFSSLNPPTLRRCPRTYCDHHRLAVEDSVYITLAKRDMSERMIYIYLRLLC